MSKKGTCIYCGKPIRECMCMMDNSDDFLGKYSKEKADKKRREERKTRRNAKKSGEIFWKIVKSKGPGNKLGLLFLLGIWEIWLKNDIFAHFLPTFPVFTPLFIYMWIFIIVLYSTKVKNKIAVKMVLFSKKVGRA